MLLLAVGPQILGTHLFSNLISNWLENTYEGKLVSFSKFISIAAIILFSLRL